jgi:hypothetical protein
MFGHVTSPEAAKCKTEYIRFGGYGKRRLGFNERPGFTNITIVLQCAASAQLPDILIDEVLPQRH